LIAGANGGASEQRRSSDGIGSSIGRFFCD
jgi:hypothetical protein